jgi:tol-pal system protein YbgF
MLITDPRRWRIATAIFIAVALTACVSPPPEPELISEPEPPAPPVNAATLQVLAGVEDLQKDIQALRNQLELQQYEIENMKTRQQAMYEDLNQRMTQNSQSSVTSTQNTQQSTQQSTQQGTAPTAAQQPAYEPITQPPTTASTSGGTATPSVSNDQIIGSDQTTGTVPTQPVVPSTQSTTGQSGAIDTTTMNQPSTQTSLEPTASMTERETYDEAFNALKQSHYDEAMEGFEGLIMAHPNGEYADDSQYWIAEAQYVTRNFDAALRGFQTVINEYPDSDRVPEAMLKIGYLQYETADYLRARRTLSDVSTRYTGSRVAFSAEARLKKMDREGL